MKKLAKGKRSVAITASEYFIMKWLVDEGYVDKPSVLQIGQAEWYGDVPLTELVQDVVKTGSPVLADQYGAAVANKDTWGLGTVFYRAVLNCKTLQAIDLHGPDAIKIDLNKPAYLPVSDIVVNSGTMEHVFHVAQFLDNIHRATKPQGLMVHGVPFTGWINHGFYSFQPTFFYDLAEANNYEIVLMLYTEILPSKQIQIRAQSEWNDLAISGESMIYSVLRKTSSSSRKFVVPMQGVYRKDVPEKLKKQWTCNRHQRHEPQEAHKTDVV